MSTIYQAVETKFLGPTNRAGSRIKAIAEAGSITLDWDYELNPAENHIKAAELLCAKFNWKYKELITGGTRTGYVHCLKR